jgi:hypothetical protein
MHLGRLRPTPGALLASVLLLIGSLAALEGAARADKIEDLCRSLTQDPSYKVRVQAALVLGKLADKRAIDSLKIALRDENESVRGVAATSLARMNDRSVISALQEATHDKSEFVRQQAQKALSTLLAATGGGGGGTTGGGGGGGRIVLAVGFQGGKASGPWNNVVRGAIAKELGKLPDVTVSISGDTGGKKDAYIVDGTISRLSASGGQVDCDLKAFVATYPAKSIKMMTTAGASLSAGPSEVDGAKRECLAAAAEAVRDEVAKYLKTLRNQ